MFKFIRGAYHGWVDGQWLPVSANRWYLKGYNWTWFKQADAIYHKTGQYHPDDQRD